MQWLVIGHSGTSDAAADEGTPWPALLEVRLAAVQPDSTVGTFRFWPAGPRAVTFALDRVDAAAPDGVILSLNAFPAVVTFVSESVRRRLGARATRAYTRAEALARKPEGDRPPGQLAILARRGARKVLGAAPHVDLDDSARVFAEVLRGLVQREHLETMVLAESCFGPNIRRLQPDIDRFVARLQAPAREVALEHRVRWINASEFVANDSSEGWAADHIHLNATGNEAYARSIADLILGSAATEASSRPPHAY